MNNSNLRPAHLAVALILANLLITLPFPLFAQAPSGAMLVPFRKGDKWGYSNIDKKIVISPIYDSAELFREGLARVSLGRRMGFIDSSGKVVIPLTFEFARDFYEGRALVFDGKLYGFVDKTGQMVIPAKYRESSFGSNFREGLAVVEYPNEKSGYIDVMGKEITGAK